MPMPNLKQINPDELVVYNGKYYVICCTLNAFFSE